MRRGRGVWRGRAGGEGERERAVEPVRERERAAAPRPGRSSSARTRTRTRTAGRARVPLDERDPPAHLFRGPRARDRVLAQREGPRRELVEAEERRGREDAGGGRGVEVGEDGGGVEGREDEGEGGGSDGGVGEGEGENERAGEGREGGRGRGGGGGGEKEVPQERGAGYDEAVQVEPALGGVGVGNVQRAVAEGLVRLGPAFELRQAGRSAHSSRRRKGSREVRTRWLARSEYRSACSSALAGGAGPAAPARAPWVEVDATGDPPS